MRLYKNKEIILVSAVAALSLGLAFFGDRFRNDKKLIEKTIDEAVQKWKNRLFLTQEQTHLMRSTLIEFAQKRNEIYQLRIQKDGKEERLRELQLRENEEMKKFLTASQYESYVTFLSEKI